MSFLATLRAGPPPPKVALLPDGLFFTRALPVAAGATAAEAAAQVELALESVSPFPVGQLYFGYHWVPGAESAFVFAAYRRRFTADQTALWAGSDLVLPAFATLLGAEVRPVTTIVLASAEGLTAIHWGAQGRPESVLFRPFPVVVEGTPEAEPDKVAEAHERLHDELIRDVGGSHAVIELDAPPAADSARSDRSVTFRTAQLVSPLAPAVVTALDVRDKGELASLRAARNRDVLLWRVAIGCVAALVLFAVGEFALIGGRQWQKVRDAKYRAQKPLVDNIMTSDKLARSIDDLVNKRLLPWEMMKAIIGEKKDRLPPEIYFSRLYTAPAKGLYTVMVEGQSINGSIFPAFKTMLKELPGVDNVESNEQARGETIIFTLTITFKPGAIKPGALL